MLPENTKSNFNVSVGRYASINATIAGAKQDFLIINYRHDEQDLDHFATKVFSQVTKLNDTAMNHFVSLLQRDPCRVDLTIHSNGISKKPTAFLFVFSISSHDIYQIEVTVEDLGSDHMLKRILETILYALLFHFKPTQIVEKEIDRSPEFEKLQDRISRRGRSQHVDEFDDPTKSYRLHQHSRGR